MEFSQHVTKVQEYFASKGLLVRMIFGRSATDDPLYHEKTNLYDLLVYFVREKDAEDAISYCHREMYCGHRLNVFPGRTPVYFDPSKSVKHTLVQIHKSGVTGQVFEQHIHNISSARIDCVVMESYKDILVQYASVEDRNEAIRKCKLCTLDLMPAGQAKQRFLEHDIRQELAHRIRTDPSFLDMLPPDNILNALLNGSRPVCDDGWKTCNMLTMPKMHQKFTRGGTNQVKLKRSAERALSLFGVQCDFLKIVPPEIQQARQERKQERLQQVRDGLRKKRRFRGRSGGNKFQYCT